MGKRYLDINPGSLEDAISKVNEKLSPKQKKLDVNKSSKLDRTEDAITFGMVANREDDFTPQPSQRDFEKSPILAKLRAGKKEDMSSDTVLPKNAVEKDPLDIKSKEPEKKITDNKTKSDKGEVNPKIDYQV